MSLTLLTGVMGSGKSNYLLEQANKIPETKRVLVKFQVDRSTTIDSRSGLKLEADILLQSHQTGVLTEFVNSIGGITHIFIDEYQFGNSYLVKEIKDLKINHNIIVAGLMYDSNMRRFGFTYLLPQYSEIHIDFKCKCEVLGCNRLATANMRKVSDEAQIHINKNDYMSVCSEHWTK